MNKGIGDYVVITLLGTLWSFDKFGLEWYGFKAILSVNAMILIYAIVIYILISIAEKFK